MFTTIYYLQQKGGSPIEPSPTTTTTNNNNEYNNEYNNEVARLQRGRHALHQGPELADEAGDPAAGIFIITSVISVAITITTIKTLVVAE